MNSRILIVVGVLGVGSAGVALLGLGPQTNSAAPAVAATAVAASSADTFTVDNVHSSLIFKISHIDVTNFYGRFNDLSGTYSLNGASSSFDIAVKTESVDSKNTQRDDHLRSPDFFNAAEFPTISFKSSKAEPAGDNRLKVTGDLSLHGVTKPITVEMKLWPAKDTRQGYKSGFETTFTIKRTDFSMDTYVANGALGDDVTITVAVEGVRE